MNLNTVVLSGSLVGDPAPGGSGKTVCTFMLSFVAPYGADRGGSIDRRDFASVVSFGKTAETCLRFLKKGSRVVVDGRLRQDRWQSPGSGQHSRLSIVADRVHFVSGLKKLSAPAPADGATSPSASDGPATHSAALL